MVKNLPAVQETQEGRVQSWVGKIPWRRKWQPTPVFLPGKAQQRSLQSMGLRRVGHDIATDTFTFTIAGRIVLCISFLTSSAEEPHEVGMPGIVYLPMSKLRCREVM